MQARPARCAGAPTAPAPDPREDAVVSGDMQGTINSLQVEVGDVVAVVEGKDGILGTPTPSRAGDASARVEAEGDKISGSKTVEKVDAVSLDVK